MLDAIKDELANDQEHVENNEHGQFEKDAKLHSLLPPNKKGLLQQNFLCLRWKVFLMNFYLLICSNPKNLMKLSLLQLLWFY